MPYVRRPHQGHQAARVYLVPPSCSSRQRIQPLPSEVRALPKLGLSIFQINSLKEIRYLGQSYTQDYGLRSAQYASRKYAHFWSHRESCFDHLNTISMRIFLDQYRQACFAKIQTHFRSLRWSCFHHFKCHKHIIFGPISALYHEK